MKKKHFKRFIAWGFTVLAVFLIASFSVPFESHADSSTCTIKFVMNRSVSSWKYEYKIRDSSLSVVETVTSDAFTRYQQPTLTLTLDSSQTLEIYAYQPGSSGIIYSTDFSNNYYNPTVITSAEITFSFNASTSLFASNGLKFDITPTPSPTPTPEPTPTPSPTQDPTITTDNQFWGKLNQNANGAWSFITQVFQGLFNNVVFRNLAIYLPLIGLIIGLVVYLFTMGGRND